MRAICAWCRAEGLPAYLGEREPLEDPVETHGLCQRHLKQLLETAQSPASSDLRLLIVVKRGDQSLYEYLTRGMAGIEGVHVIADRRHGERRREAHPVSGECRRADRRQSRGVVQSMDCVFVRFGQASGVLRTL